MPQTSQKLCSFDEGSLMTAPQQILLIEDNYYDVLLISKQLQEAAGEESVEITHVPRLSEALELLDQQEFKVILLDLNLLDADGTGVIHVLHEKAPDIAIAVYSGTSDPMVRQEAILSGASYYMVKGKNNGALLWHIIRCRTDAREDTEGHC